MNLEDQVKNGINQISITDSLEAPLLSLKVKRTASTTIPNGTTDLIVYVDTAPKTNPTSNRKQFLFELGSVLGFISSTSDEFVLEVKVKKNDIKSIPYVIRRISNGSVLSTPTVQELDESLITLFEGTNYIYTNYTNDSIELVYPKNDDLNKRYLNNALFAYHRMNSSGDFSLDDIYFKDAFTKTGDNLNLEVNNIEIETLTSKNNAFSMDANGNLVVNSITTNSNSGGNVEIRDFIYPVGSIYMSVASTSPATLFGGTWEQLKDKFLLGAGDTYTAGQTGGEATHTLTTSELPSHTHKEKLPDTWHFKFSTGTTNGYVSDCTTGTYHGDVYDSSAYTDATGGGLSHNNMPPYLTVYMWKRTA